MRLDFIPLDKLVVSRTNMRFGKRPPDVSDILPGVCKRGVLVPVLVHPDPRSEPVGPETTEGQGRMPGGFEIVAGARRFRAAQIVADEHKAAGEAGASGPGETMLPCAILDDADDAAAIEASLIENIARLDPDEVTQCTTFTRLVKEGRTPDEIGLTFGMPDLAVRRVLALGNLLPRIRALYAADDIDKATVRLLTMASKRQQQDWLALWDDPEACAPRYGNLKARLLGGDAILVDHALFEVQGSGLAVVADLFGEGACFADAAAFWAAQNNAVEARRAGYIDAGWADAVIVGPSDHFQSWDYEKTPKRKGGRVYLDIRSSGEVVIHEGYVSRREVQRASRGGEGPDADAKPARAEVTAALGTYIDLHRHAAVRADLTAHPGVALRLLVAHAIIGSPLVRVTPEPQTARHDDIRQSVFDSAGEASFDERRRAVLALIGASPDDPHVTGGNGDEIALGALFMRLLDLPDPALMDVVAIVMGEALASGSAAVDLVALKIGTDMADWWVADTALFDLLRDKEVLTGMIAEVAAATGSSAGCPNGWRSRRPPIPNAAAWGRCALMPARWRRSIALRPSARPRPFATTISPKRWQLRLRPKVLATTLTVPGRSRVTSGWRHSYPNWRAASPRRAPFSVRIGPEAGAARPRAVPSLGRAEIGIGSARFCHPALDPGPAFGGTKPIRHHVIEKSRGDVRPRA